MSRAPLKPPVLAALLMLVLAGLLAASGRSAPAFAPAPHRNPPAVPNDGGAGKPLRIITLVPATYTNADQLLYLGTALSSSVWLKKVSQAWHIPAHPQASLAYKATGMPDLLHQSLTVGDYQDYIFKKMTQLGVGKLPGYQTIYILYVPCAHGHGMDTFKCVSHHPRLDPTRAGVAPAGQTEGDLLFTQGDSIAAVLGAQSKTLDENTTAASHETAEAATNSLGVGQWRLHTAHPDAPYLDAPPWVRATGTVEMADLAGGTRWYEHTAHGTFRLQRIYSNAASAAGGDPDVPKSPLPYWNVSTEKDWLPFSGAASADVSAKAWSAAPYPAWKLTAKAEAWKGQKAGRPDPCQVPSTTWTVQNGSSVVIPVAIVHPHGPKSWCTLKLTSTAFVFNFAVQADVSHFWNVGLIVGRA